MIQISLPRLLIAPEAFEATNEGGRSVVVVEYRGGTNVTYSPPIDHTQHVLLPLLLRMGISASLKVFRRGYYPRGGGVAVLEIQPPFHKVSSLPAERSAPAMQADNGDHMDLVSVQPPIVQIKVDPDPERVPVPVPTPLKPLDLVDRGRLVEIRGFIFGDASSLERLSLRDEIEAQLRRGLEAGLIRRDHGEKSHPNAQTIGCTSTPADSEDPGSSIQLHIAIADDDGVDSTATLGPITAAGDVGREHSRRPSDDPQHTDHPHVKRYKQTGEVSQNGDRDNKEGRGDGGEELNSERGRGGRGGGGGHRDPSHSRDHRYRNNGRSGAGGGSTGFDVFTVGAQLWATSDTGCILSANISQQIKRRGADGRVLSATMWSSSCRPSGSRIQPDTCTSTSTSTSALSQSSSSSSSSSIRALTTAELASEVVSELSYLCASGACVDEHTADQLVLFAGLAAGRSRLLCTPREEKSSLHLETVVKMTADLTGARISVDPYQHDGHASNAGVGVAGAVCSSSRAICSDSEDNLGNMKSYSDQTHQDEATVILASSYIDRLVNHDRGCRLITIDGIGFSPSIN
jgi:hypothetical protein